MKTKFLPAVLMLLLVAGLVWINRPHPVVAPTPATLPPQAALPKLPAHFVGTSHPEHASEPKSSNHFREWLKDGQPGPKLTPEQLEGYLRANHRNAESLLGALYT